MSKRNTKQGFYQRTAPSKRGTPAGKIKSKRGGNGKTSGARNAGAQSGSARSYNRSAPAAPRVPVRASLLTVRVAAILVTVAAVTGGLAWALSIKGSYGIGQIAGLIVLGFLAGLGIAFAIYTNDLVARVAKLMRARR